MKEKKLKRSDEYIAYRVMLAFVESAVFLFLMARLYKVLDVPTTYSQGKIACIVVAAVAGICAVMGVVSYILSIKRDTYRRGRVLNGMFFAYFAAVVMVSALMLWYNHLLGMVVIYVMIPASAFLFLIYSVYPKQLFITSVTHSYVAFALYALSRLTENNLRIFAMSSACALCALALALYFFTKKNKGRLRIAGIDFILFGREVGDNYVCTLYGVTFAVLVAAFVLGPLAAFYCMFAAIAFLVVSIVHGTVRMM